MNQISNIFQSSSNKKVHFQTVIHIESLTDIPLVNGLFYVKWKVQKGQVSQRNYHPDVKNSNESIDSDKNSQVFTSYTNSTSSKGKSHVVPLKDHSVIWNYQTSFAVILTLHKDGSLSPCDIVITVKQETAGGKKAETFGRITINLSEFAQTKFSSRQYLLQESKSNSTLKVNINMTQILGNSIIQENIQQEQELKEDNYQIFPDIKVMSQTDQDPIDLYPCNYGEVYGQEFSHIESHKDIIDQLFKRVMKQKDVEADQSVPNDEVQDIIISHFSPILTP